MSTARDVTAPKPSAAALDVDPALFRHVLGHFPTGVTVIAATGSSGPVGLAVGSFFSVSLDPPLVGFCPANSSSSWPEIKRAGSFCVNVLAQDQVAVCRQFAVSGGDKFAGLSWDTTGSGSPRLVDVLAWIDCDVEAIYPGGDHDICVGRVRALAVERSAGPLLFYRGRHEIS
ncbi:flavin reductase family protein [Streptosporangium sp. NPDC002544]|uniref:flavin reductase family protein n=1 Tax=unclassified Streptosporangium TaxID=2632669 RepID=UPI0033256829